MCAAHVSSITSLTVALNATATHNESLEPPLISDHLVLEEIIGTAWHSIDRIVTAHDAGHTALANTCLKCWEVGLKIGCVHMCVFVIAHVCYVKGHNT